ncbi:DUF421 domain-containing protein [Bacillus sp. IB182487]|uniref:DUF421 domain-containing protein n=1 Tax=Metabacillus arenae TaxID=2771434 RepID=A0A926RX31_9BACI|nr:DUF421 domain-containing protein [Metabacillus arenae]
MDFFHSKETLTELDWILRACVSFFFLLGAAKIMGQRSISQLRLLDFVMALLLGNIIAHPLSDEELGLKGSMITMSVLVILYLFAVFLSLKWGNLKKFLDPAPFPLIKNGQIFYKNLRKARISVEYLLSQLRKEKIEDIYKVALALWEPDGTMSIFLKPTYQTVTASDLNLQPKAFSLPQPIIKDGKIDFVHLNHSGKNEQWLKEQIIQTYQVEIQDVLLATLEENNKVKIQLYK